MPNLEKELADLALADKHVATGEKGVDQMTNSLERQRRAGGELALFEHALVVAKASLHEFLAHRELILATIADLHAGRLPST